MRMDVCTLYEGEYHRGLAGLTNSLCAHGFQGTVWAGYRGDLPPWAEGRLHQNGHPTFAVTPGCHIKFVKVETPRHFTNYKPEFMRLVWERYCPEADGLFYFDPDITILCRWSYFEEWITDGVALCEDVNSPLPQTHPLRNQWRRIYERHGIPLRFVTPEYANAGFVGIGKAHQVFLHDWCRALDVMHAESGGLEEFGNKFGGRDHPFNWLDQDALNIAVSMGNVPVSVIGQEGMCLKPGGYTMAHSLGYPKGWSTGFTRLAISGHPPSASVKAYFDHIQRPIQVFSPVESLLRKVDLRLASLIGRFYRRN